MGSKMLIDATHPEETRVVVSRGDRIEEFDYESASRKQLKGNIYLAKVTRVEPSLQAAFVDYGGNRHGFLAFTEIHPDYYQIPIADRQALLQQEEEDAHREAEEENGKDSDEAAEHPEQEPVSVTSDREAETSRSAESSRPSEGEETASDERPSSESVGGGIETIDEDPEGQRVESIGAEDALEEVPQRPRRPPRRNYKIQEVIKRRQVILVQVVKEERGNKGAALTTYLSLAGRYCVLMPNTARGGGISRKITDAGDRRRLKDVARDIEVPEGMGLIVRTAGAQRTKTEIKRDFDYLIRLWENVRDLTLNSQAPALVYEEGSLIKRAIRDLYTKDVEEVLVEGDDAYREAKDFMKMLMPSHARNVKLYKDARPLFSRYQIESQLDTLFSQTVTLQSGGYMVINQTEALVSIDINSGKATREHNIEDTAYKTNLEASDEIARQLRLRDLAGLIVIDFIDMEEKRNNRGVERRLKEALKHDRARIQVGRISHFGLLEMSRQRLRPGLLEGSTKVCPTCEGRGIVRSISSCALSVLRAIEENLISRKPENLTVKCHPEVAFYVLNEKRDHLLSIETNYGISIFLSPSHEVKSSQAIIERGAERALPAKRLAGAPVMIDSAYSEPEPAVDEEPLAESEEIPETDEGGEPRRGGDTEDGGRRRRRRGRRGGRRGREGDRHRAVERQGDIPGLGEQPAVDDGEENDAIMPGAPTVESDVGAAHGRERRDHGRRDRGRRRDRVEERGRKEAAPDGGAASEPSPTAAADEDEVQTVSAAAAAPPLSEPTAAVAVVEVQPAETAETVVRKWQPPSPTVTQAPAQPKAGWWRRKTS
ncbi:MAG: ribonuclease E/G [Rhizobiales bacterium]|nr:ribonuclease E/G [Hyphomicrobiales bacterium]